MDYPLYSHPTITSFRQLIEQRVQAHAESAAFQYERAGEIVTVTYLEFQQDIRRLAAFFQSQNLYNSKIAVLGENSYEWILAYFAVVMSGNVIVPLDKELSNEDIAYLLEFSGAETLVHSASYDDIAESQLQAGKIKIVFSMNEFPALCKKGEAVLSLPGYHEIQTDENAVCAIIFTSGTTGKPKGVMLSQRNLMIDAVGGCRNAFFSGKSLLTLPLHHTFAFTAGVLVMLVYGLPICINSSLRKFMDDIKRYQPQNMFLVPLYVETIYKTIWKAAEDQGKAKLLKNLIKVSNALRKVGIDLRKKLFHSVLGQLGGNLDLIVSGGAPLKQFYIDAMDDLGIQILNGYGITECAPVVAVNRNKYYQRGSIGLPLDCCEIKVQDGEIWVKGDNVMLGYYRDEQATKEVLEDGWFKTGDMGYLDDDGFLYITGRKKNLIILSNGKNVAPEELEERILDIPHVLEVVVYAEDDHITAEIFADEETDIQARIMQLNKELPTYKRIQKVKFRDSEFEKTTTKKIKRQ